MTTTTFAAATIRDLRALLNEIGYDALPDGSYSDLPTWGPQTDRVRDLINASGPDGDIASWDTRSEDVSEHVYLMRETDAGVSTFRLRRETDLA